jgi:hypothetical protein
MSTDRQVDVANGDRAAGVRDADPAQFDARAAGAAHRIRW